MALASLIDALLGSSIRAAGQCANRLVDIPDFSVVRFRPHFMLVSEGYPMKMHKNQWVLNTLFPHSIGFSGKPIAL